MLQLDLTTLHHKYRFEKIYISAQGPHSHILMTGGQSDFFGSEILAKSDFFETVKDAGNFFGYAKKVVIFLGRQILKL